MKNKKKIYLISGIVIAILLIAFFAYKFFSDENKLTRDEKRWIADNLSTVQNINVINDINVFGDNGSGVFYDFLNDLESEHQLQINPVTFLQGENPEGISFKAGNTITNNSTIFYTDHYVIVGKDVKVYKSITEFKNVTLGLLNTDKDYLSNSLTGYSFKEYESLDALYEGLKNGDVDFVIVPIMRDLDRIFSNTYVVNYHLSDIKYYFYFEGIENDTLSSIIKKYFNNWKEEYFNEIFNTNEYTAITNALGISESDLSDIHSKNFNYGFINYNPYEVITGGNFGGISAVYLKKFSDFSGVEFNFKKYKNQEKFKKAINNKDVDIYFNYYNYNNGLENISTNYAITFNVIAPNDNYITINDLNNVKEKLYVLKDSKLSEYILTNYHVNLGYFDNQKEMLKLAKKGNLIIIDSSTFNFYHKNKLKSYEARYTETADATYSYKVLDNKGLKPLLAAYVQTLDPNQIKYEGLYNHSVTVKRGETLAKIAEYFMLIIAVTAAGIFAFYKKNNRIIVTKKIKNDDKIKYIDLLTSLKNRNYLSENMELWNNNTIYPQTMIVIDLNNVAYLNDTKGYEAGDKQITAMANILIKTQLDNSDVMRTNGNEFLIYLVGYQQKHIVNYIHKLTKEMKKLPYEYGAAIGYSMITDDIKTIEDAINEAIEDMKKQKEKEKEVKN